MVDRISFSLHVRHNLILLGIVSSISSWLFVEGVWLSRAIATTSSVEIEHIRSNASLDPGPRLINQSHHSQLITQQFGDGGSSQAVAEVMSFSTERYSVRIYRQGTQTFMDLFDPQAQRYILQRTPASLVSPANTFWRTYRSALGSVEVFARNNPNGNTELEIFSGGQRFYFGQGALDSVIQPVPSNPAVDQGTRLSFDTSNYRVRVYQMNNQLMMDLIDIPANAFLIRQSPAAIAPQQQTVATSRTYVSTQGAYQVFASVNSNRVTELQLWSNGNQVYRGAGFNASGADLGFSSTPTTPSTGYQGNDFAVPTQGRIIARTANLHDRLSIDGMVIATVLQCTAVTVRQKQYNTGDRYVWYFVEIPGQAQGWVRGDAVNIEQAFCG